MAAVKRLSEPIDPARGPRRHRRGGRAAAVVVVLLVVTAVVAAAGWYARGRGYRAWVSHKYFGGPVPFAKRPGITGTRPGHYDGSVALGLFAARRSRNLSLM